jgi:transporter family protein
MLATAMGTTWTLAIACMAYGMGVLKLPVSVIAPLTNSNALIAVLVGGVVFSEWRNLNLSLVALGTLLICAGATVISLSR